MSEIVFQFHHYDKEVYPYGQAGRSMGRGIWLRIFVAILFATQSFVIALPTVEANMVNTSSTSHQISSQSSYVEFSGASGTSVSDLSEAYDGDSTTGSFARIRTYPCENFNNGPACTSGSHGQVDFSIQTTATMSSSFTIDFDHQMVAYCSTSPKVTFSIWNIQTTSWTLMDTESSTGGYNLNRTYSSDYMTSGGEITIRWRAESGCSSTGSNEYILSRLYEFHVYAPDSDGDGVPDFSDQCPNGATGWSSSTGPDHDSDGCHDLVEDSDDDDDGIDDNLDYCQTGHLGWTSASANDHDSDGCNDNVEDNDDDNDTILDVDDSCHFGALFISDSTNDYDSDGCQDETEDSDDDNDTISDNLDNCSKGIKNWISDVSNDNDEDGCRDNDEDDDDDNDGFNDTIEGTCLSDPLDDQSIPINSDGTGDCDELDDDDDDDGTLDSEDDFPFDPSEQVDTDEDGIGNNEDIDDDWDGYDDIEEINCGSDPLNNTSIPANFDGDELCDELDPDDDNDEFNDTIDAFPFNSIEWADFDGDGTGDVADPDDDDDGFADTYEEGCGTNPTDNSSSPQDLDGDGQCDGLDPDVDGDGWSNDLEDDCYSNPTSNLSTPPDMDGDGQCDEEDDDTDGDGWSNIEEDDCNTNALDNSSVPVDLDNNTICDDLEDQNNSNNNNSANNNSGNNSQNTDNNSTMEDPDKDLEINGEPSANSFESPYLLAGLFIAIILILVLIFNTIKQKKSKDNENEEDTSKVLEIAHEAVAAMAQVATATATVSANASSIQNEAIKRQGQVMDGLEANQQDLDDRFEHKVEYPEEFLKSCLSCINNDIKIIPEKLQQWATSVGTEDKSSQVEVRIDIGSTYIPAFCTEVKAREILQQCILHFLSKIGGKGSKLLGGYSPEEKTEVHIEPTFGLTSMMNYQTLLSSLEDLRVICEWACKYLHQECVYVSLVGKTSVGGYVNPLTDIEKAEIKTIRSEHDEVAYTGELGAGDHMAKFEGLEIGKYEEIIKE